MEGRAALASPGLPPRFQPARAWVLTITASCTGPATVDSGLAHDDQSLRPREELLKPNGVALMLVKSARPACIVFFTLSGDMYL